MYQQTFIATYSEVADAKLYTEKSAITAADMLNDMVIPFFEEQEIPLMRILTDRGTEYSGTLENHAFELFLSIEGIDHTKTKAYTPWHTIKAFPTVITYVTIRKDKNTSLSD